MVVMAAAASSHRAALVSMALCHSARSSRPNGIGDSCCLGIGWARTAVVIGSPPR
jgi:hypothetical protein